VIKHLPGKCEALSSTPVPLKKKTKERKKNKRKKKEIKM
jgi:hypothetical protein